MRGSGPGPRGPRTRWEARAVSSSLTPGRETLREPNLAFPGGHESVGSQPTAEDFPSPRPSDTVREG